MERLAVSRLELSRPQTVGFIESDGASFRYDLSYLEADSAIPLSLSLPLGETPYSAEQFRPYFEGLLAEGATRQELAAELQLPEDDWLSLLAACGSECIGDVVIVPDSQEQAGGAASTGTIHTRISTCRVSRGYS